MFIQANTVVQPPKPCSAYKPRGPQGIFIQANTVVQPPKPCSAYKPRGPTRYVYTS